MQVADGEDAAGQSQTKLIFSLFYIYNLIHRLTLTLTDMLKVVYDLFTQYIVNIKNSRDYSFNVDVISINLSCLSLLTERHVDYVF